MLVTESPTRTLADLPSAETTDERVATHFDQTCALSVVGRDRI
jgi:hypothetical protein